ncbi:MAG: tetratricopeptide repeat protein [Acidobacteria bacterium]|nr:tetratricopeptide repeat protein [Acidobacteriota bacterium]
MRVILLLLLALSAVEADERRDKTSAAGKAAVQADDQAEGLNALEARNWEAAAQSFTRAAKASPGDYGAHFHLAFALSMLRRDPEAIAEYKKVLELKPGLYEAGLNLGVLLLRNRQPMEAAAHLAAAVKQKPQEFRPVYYLGEAQLGAANAAAAEEAFKQAVVLDPRSGDAEVGLARALAKQNKVAEAAPHFHKAVELDPSAQDALLELASLYERHRQGAEAIALYARFPEDAGARERLGELLLESGKAAAAIPHLQAAVQKSPTAANRYALAAAYVANKETVKALPILEQALEAEPANPELRLMYARALRDQRQFEPAAEQFFRVTQAKPDSAEGWSELAGMLVLLERYPEALAALDKVRALGTETAGHHYLRAIVLDKHQQYKPALESYEKFLSMSQGKNPNEEFKARQRVRILRKELSKR